MSRARLLKPSFFLNDTLAEVPPLGRLLFQALWCLADREGRLEDKPAKIRVQALPYDDCDIEALLADLTGRDFIIRYAVSGERYIQVTKFTLHQSPHMREPASAIPAPPASYVCAGQAPDRPGASPVLAPDKHDPGPAVTRSGNPFPDPVTDPVHGNPEPGASPVPAAEPSAAAPPPELLVLYRAATGADPPRKERGRLRDIAALGCAGDELTELLMTAVERKASFPAAYVLSILNNPDEVTHAEGSRNGARNGAGAARHRGKVRADGTVAPDEWPDDSATVRELPG